MNLYVFLYTFVDCKNYSIYFLKARLTLVVFNELKHLKFEGTQVSTEHSQSDTHVSPEN